MKILFTDRALESIKEIHQFNSTFSKSFARKMHKKIMSDIRTVIQFPNAAPIEPLMENESATFRSLVVAEGRYKVFILLTI